MKFPSVTVILVIGMICEISTAQAGDVLTPSLQDQVRANWNAKSIASAPHLDQLAVIIHLTLMPDGTIKNVTYDNDRPNDPYFKEAAESARRALLVIKKLRLPPGKTYDRITFIFRPGDQH